MGFWAKRILVMCLVIAAAIALILYMPAEQSFDETGKPIEKKSIQSNMAKFYEEFSLVSSDQITEEYGEYVIPLEMPNSPLAAQINTLAQTIPKQNRNFNWRGDFKQRAFAQDSTLMNNAYAYVSDEGMELIWHLNQDFIVRHRFVSRNTVVGMLQELAGAIDANFVGTVKVHYCQSHRVLVITDKQDPVLLERCTQLDVR